MEAKDIPAAIAIQNLTLTLDRHLTGDELVRAHNYLCIVRQRLEEEQQGSKAGFFLMILATIVAWVYSLDAVISTGGGAF